MAPVTLGFLIQYSCLCILWDPVALTPLACSLRPDDLFWPLSCPCSPAGYRCFKAVLFLTGLLFGSVVIFLLCYRERVLETQLSAGASAGIALGIGLLCGLVAMLVRSVGLFLVGLLLGLLLAAAALLGSAPYYQPGSVWGPLGLLLGGGLLCALLTLRWPRPLTTLATAVTGAALIATAADYFAELLLLGRYVVERLRAAPVPPLCWRSWALLALWPLLSLMGVLVQWRVTTESDSHTEGERTQARADMGGGDGPRWVGGSGVGEEEQKLYTSSAEGFKGVGELTRSGCGRTKYHHSFHSNVWYGSSARG